MKRWICALLVVALAMFALSGCDRRSEAPEEAAEADFAPETTSVGGLTLAVEEQEGSAGEPDAEVPEDVQDGAEPGSADDVQESDDSQDVAEDQPVEAGASPEPTATSDTPFATPTPQPNASVAQYSEVTAPGLGFRFSYPTGWINIPARSTVCYVQPLTEGTVYPARVAVTMKRLPHKAEGMTEVRDELADYIRNLMTQYNSNTFRVNTNLDLKTKFMGKAAISTTYLAYDGDQEIQGYTIITYFERYLYVFHFLCAYDDYTSFQAALRYMRDSVVADSSVAPD